MKKIFFTVGVLIVVTSALFFFTSNAQQKETFLYESQPKKMQTKQPYKVLEKSPSDIQFRSTIVEGRQLEPNVLKQNTMTFCELAPHVCRKFDPIAITSGGSFAGKNIFVIDGNEDDVVKVYDQNGKAIDQFSIKFNTDTSQPESKLIAIATGSKYDSIYVFDAANNKIKIFSYGSTGGMLGHGTQIGERNFGTSVIKDLAAYSSYFFVLTDPACQIIISAGTDTTVSPPISSQEKCQSIAVGPYGDLYLLTKMSTGSPGDVFRVYERDAANGKWQNFSILLPGGSIPLKRHPLAVREDATSFSVYIGSAFGILADNFKKIIDKNGYIVRQNQNAVHLGNAGCKQGEMLEVNSLAVLDNKIIASDASCNFIEALDTNGKFIWMIEE